MSGTGTLQTTITVYADKEGGAFTPASFADLLGVLAPLTFAGQLIGRVRLMGVKILHNGGAAELTIETAKSMGPPT
jgi:hypothetical protein